MLHYSRMLGAMLVITVVLVSAPGRGGLMAADAAMSRTISGSLPYQLYPLWDFSGPSKLSPPVSAHGRVYVGSDEGVMYALDANSGEVVWSFQASGRIRQPAAVSLGSIYFAAGDLVSGRLYALHPSDGTVRWSYDFTGSMVGAPVIQHPLLYFAYNAQTGNVAALSVFDGAPEWIVQADHYLSGQLAVRESTTIFGTTLTPESTSYLYAVDSTTGALAWYRTTSGYFSGVSLLDGYRAVVTTGGASTGRIYLLDVRSGEEMWAPYRVRPFNFWSPPSVHGEYLYSLNKGVVHALDLARGEAIWTRELPTQGDDGPLPFSYAPWSCASYLYVTYAYADPRLHSQLYVLDRHEGTLLALYRTGTTLTAPPTLSGRNVYLVGQEGRLEARRGLKIVVNGLALSPAESGAFIEAGTSFVALRALLEVAGYGIDWDEATRSVIARKGEQELVVRVDSRTVSRSGGAQGHLTLQLVNDRLMVAVRELVDFLGGQIAWHADELSVSCLVP